MNIYKGGHIGHHLEFEAYVEKSQISFQWSRTCISYFILNFKPNFGMIQLNTICYIYYIGNRQILKVFWASYTDHHIGSDVQNKILHPMYKGRSGYYGPHITYENPVVLFTLKWIIKIIGSLMWYLRRNDIHLSYLSLTK